MSILAKIFPLNEDGASDNYEKFKAFWSQVEGCKVEKIDMKNYTPPRKAEDFKKQLKDLKNTFEEGGYEYLVLAVSSHGVEQEQDTVEKDSTGNDKTGIEVSLEIAWRSNRYKVNELLKIFEDVKDKQKIFIMQMCRNRSDERTVTKLGRDQGVHHSNTVPSFGSHVPANGNQQTPEELSTGASGRSLSTGALNSMPWPKTWKLAQPCIRDSIVMFSSPSGYLSYHNLNMEDAGGWIFVSMEKLLKSLKGEKISVIDLFLMVNQKMSETFTINDKYIGLSSFNHMLTQDIIIKFKN
ncbi:uncharacterized protein LOC143071877 [Mytilus galloprovincialis]|uniref:uncharacterized protein LOC143071877 n=1 Tax=Mytilus galloprovincialis TaxID=29158 RepID=UPI003F7B75A7